MRVMFIDDEPNVLSGLRRILRPMRKEWEMRFEDGGQAALDSLSDTPCDVVVSDMKMPGMDGAELLSAVKERYPASIRIALSGETDSHMIYRCVQHAHQYLAKPCDPDALVGAVKRAFTLRALMNDEALEKVVAELSTLPSLPEAYSRIMQELQSEDPSLQEVAKIVESDVAMTAKILQLVNSAFFGLARHLSSPAEAAMYLGVDVLKSLVLTTGVFSQFDDSEIDAATLRSIWNSSTRVGTLAKEIVMHETNDKLQADYALMGGLLTEVGKLVFASSYPDKFVSVTQRIATEDRSEIDIEKEVIGHSHTEVGAFLIGLWGLPNPVVECVAFHHKPADCVDAGFTPLTAVHAATAIVVADGGDAQALLDQDYIEQLGLTDRIAEWTSLSNELEIAEQES